MQMLESNFDYKGYTMWHTCDHIIMLYIPKAEIDITHYALSFDNGKTWCIGNNKTVVCSEFDGSFTDAIDMCTQLNEEIQNEKQ